MRLAVAVPDAVRQRAATRGIPCTRIIREAVEHALARHPRS
jgi:predicted DNA binding CopG/RHH family protein